MGGRRAMNGTSSLSGSPRWNDHLVVETGCTTNQSRHLVVTPPPYCHLVAKAETPSGENFVFLLDSRYEHFITMAEAQSLPHVKCCVCLSTKGEDWIKICFKCYRCDRIFCFYCRLNEVRIKLCNSCLKRNTYFCSQECVDADVIAPPRLCTYCRMNNVSP